MINFRKKVSKFFPIKTKQETEKRYRSPWLSKPIIKCINKRHSFFKLAKQGEIQKSYYLKYSKLVDRLIEIAREHYFINTFNKSVKNSKALWRNIKRLKGDKVKSPIFNIEDNGLTITDRKAVNGTFNNFFLDYPKELQSNLPVAHATYQVPLHPRSIYLKPTCPPEIINVIGKLKKKDTLGEIPLRVIQLSLFEFSELLSTVFNEMLIEGVYPDRLKLARVVPVHKGDSKKDKKNFRPISILPIIDKIFETLLYDRLIDFLNDERILSENQFGFRKNKSTEQAVLKVFDHLSPTYQKGGYSICIFADIQKAFDTINHSRLCSKLHSYGIINFSSLFYVIVDNLCK